jgi:glutamine cyclotransferase
MKSNRPIPRQRRARTAGKPPTPPRRWIVPPQRIPHLIVFVVITVGSLIAWTIFMAQPRVGHYDYEIVARYPHDTNAFTQGLVYLDGKLYESTGIVGQSGIRVTDLQTGKVTERRLETRDFGEGLALHNNQLFQLTLDSGVAFVYDLDLKPVGHRDCPEPAWGLTSDGEQLILSDGSATLYFLNPDTFEVTHRIRARYGAQWLSKLNELEYVRGRIFANVWYSDSIYEIDPATGRVIGVADLGKLYPPNERPNDDAVLNGIAYDHTTGRFFVTGKNWPEVFEIELRPR